MAEATTPGDALGAPELSFGELNDRVELLELLTGAEAGMGLISPAFWAEWREAIPRSHSFFDPNERDPVRGDGHEHALFEFRKVRYLLGRLAPNLVPRLPRINGHDDVSRMDSVDAAAAADACRELLFSLWPEWPHRLQDVRYLFYLAKPETWDWSEIPGRALSLCHGVSITAKSIAAVAPNLLPLLPFQLPWAVVGKDTELPETDDSPSNTITRYYDPQGNELTKLPFELGECFYGLRDVEIVRGFRRVLTGLLWPAERPASVLAEEQREAEIEAAQAIATPLAALNTHVDFYETMLLPASIIAKELNLPAAAVRKSLERWRDKNMGSNDWEQEEGGPRNKPSYKYRMRAVRHHLLESVRQNPESSVTRPPENI